MARPLRDRAHPTPGASSRASIAANRANAQKSTGPKSLSGKKSVARNSLRHGLTVSVWADPSHSEQAEKLAVLIAGEGAEASRLALARRIAEAQIDLNRVRAARFRLLARGINNPDYRSARDESHAVKLIISALKVLDRKPAGDIDSAVAARIDSLIRPLDATERTAAVIGNLARQLTRLGRYETRALSRRKTAIKAFDAARFDRS